MLSFSWEIKKMFLMGLIAGYAVFAVLFVQIPDGKFHVYFLDIGQGDSIFIKTPQNHQILIDGGPENVVIDKLSEVLPFFDKSIDFVILTHPHADHVDGLVEVLARYDVENLLFTGVEFEESSYDEFLRLVDEQEIDFYLAEAGMDFLFGDVFMDVIYPYNIIAGESYDNLNNSSIAVRISYNGRKILLTGDLEIEAEKELLSLGADLKADIYKAGHHGSKTASSLSFLKKIKPDIVVIQCGEDNSFGHPHAEVLENFETVGVEEIYRNDIDGTVEFVF